MEEVVCGGGGSEEAVGGEICARDVGEGERSARERETCRGGREICERDAGEGEEPAAAGAVRMTG